MNNFIFCFGYKTDNQINDEDAESFGVLVISAKDPESALEWGRVLAGWYVGKINTRFEVKTWRSDCYASWVETSPDVGVSTMANQMKPVRVGEFPDIAAVRVVLGDGN